MLCIGSASAALSRRTSIGLVTVGTLRRIGDPAA